MTDADIALSLEGESHTFPWGQFKSVTMDDFNVYLFLTKTAAFIVPSGEMPPDANAFMLSHVRTPPCRLTFVGADGDQRQ